MVLFPVLALLVCFVILKGADMESVWNAMKNAKPQWLAAGLILAVVFNIAEAINLRSVLNSFGYQVSFRQGMKYAYTGYFFSSITPSATDIRLWDFFIPVSHRLQQADSRYSYM